MKIRYGFEILEHLAELFLGAYMSEILFKLLISGYDIDLWLSDLKPALPLPKDICKGISFMAFNTCQEKLVIKALLD